MSEPIFPYAHLQNCARKTQNSNSIESLRIRFNPDQHIYLKDHCFGGKALVPAAMIIELFCESALWFAERMEVLKKDRFIVSVLENLSIERALAIDSGKFLDVDILLREMGSDGDHLKLTLQIVSKRINLKGVIVGRRRNASAEVTLTTQVPKVEPMRLPEGIDYQYYYLNMDEHYAYFYPSHGPLFQSLTGKFGLDRQFKYLLGEYDCKDKERAFIQGQTSIFVISPLGYDSAFQYAVLLAGIQFLKSLLPVGCTRLTVLKHHPVRGKCYVLVKSLAIDDKTMVSDITIFDAQKAVIMRAEGFKIQKSPHHQYARDDMDKIMRTGRTDS